MKETRRKSTREFKVAAVRRRQAGFPVGLVARELEVNPNQLHAWRREFEQRPNTAFSGEDRRRREESPVAELERKIGQQAMEINFLEGCLRQLEQCRPGATQCYSAVRNGHSAGSLQPGTPDRLCQLLVL